MKKLCQIFIITAFVVATSLTLYAHSGRTDSSGGHYNRKTGEYHYHNSGSSPYSAPSTASTPPSKSYSEPSDSFQQLQARNLKLSAENENQRELIAQLKATYITLKKENKLMKQTLTDANIPIPKPSEESEQTKPIRITENHWQVALNKKAFNGKLEVTVSTGRVDIVTDSLVIEVDKASKYQEGIEQALKYAKATEKKPVLALYIDGEKDGYELLQQADNLCKEKGVTLLLANSYVSVNDLIELISEAGVGPTAESKPLPIVKTNNDSQLVPNTTNNQDSELKYWITNSSGVRHNSSCRYYMNSNGRKCSKNEGRACKICGG